MILQIHFILGNLAFMLAMIFPQKLNKIVSNSRKISREWRSRNEHSKQTVISQEESIDFSANTRETSILRLILLYISFVSITWILITFQAIIAFFLKIHLKLKK